MNFVKFRRSLFLHKTPLVAASVIGMKISVLPPTQLVFTVIEVTILQQILQILE